MAACKHLVVMVIMPLALFLLAQVNATDPELTQDYLVPGGVNATADFFTFTGFRNGPNAAPGTFKPIKAFAEAFPALSGLGISAALLEYQPGSQNVPHTHPRATELLFVIQGNLLVGLVDTAGNFFKQTLSKGDLFVFPKGLVHFQVNSWGKTAYALAAFSSASPGTVSLPATLFGSGIPSGVLSQAFHVDARALAELRAPFPPSHS